MCNCSVYGKNADHIVYDGFPCAVPHQEKMQKPRRTTEVCSFPSPQIIFPSSWNASDVAFPTVLLTGQEQGSGLCSEEQEWSRLQPSWAFPTHCRWEMVLGTEVRDTATTSQ